MTFGPALPFMTLGEEEEGHLDVRMAPEDTADQTNLILPACSICAPRVDSMWTIT